MPPAKALSQAEFEQLQNQIKTLAAKLEQCSPEQHAALTASLHSFPSDAGRQLGEAYYSKWFEVSSDAIFVQTGGVFQVINPAGLRLFGVENEAEILGKKILDFIHPDDQDRVRARIRQLNEDRVRVPQIEQKMLRKDGSTVYVAAVATPFVYQGQPGALVILHDISERVEAEQKANQSQEKLRQSEEHYRLLFETMLQGVVYQDRDGKIISMNPSAVRILGKSPEDFLGQTSEDTEHDTMREDGSPFPGQEHPAMVSLATGQEIKGVLMGVYNPRRKEYRWISISAVPLFRPGESTPYQVYTLFDDVTEQRRIEENAEEGKRILDALMEYVPEGITIADPDMVIRMVSRRGQEILGAAHNNMTIEAVVTEWNVLRPDGSPLETRELPLMRALNGETVWDMEVLQINTQGKQLSLLCNAAPIRANTGEITGAIVAWREITERKLAEAALRQSEARYHSLFEGMSEGFALHEIVLDQQDVPVDYIFLDINPAFERLTGLRREDVVGKRKSEVPQLQNDDPKWIEIYGKVAVTGEPIHFENYSPALKQAYEVFAYRPAPGQFAVIFMNITERKQMEKAMQEMEIQRRLLDFREKERQDIARDLHDGPVQDLSGLIFNIQFAKEAISDANAQLELEDIGHGLRGVVRDLRGMINEMRPPSLIRFGLAKSIRFHAQDFMEKHPETQIVLDLDDDGYELESLTEQTRLSLFRIYQESLNNILRHARASQAWVDFHVDREKKQVVLRIRDNGVGFEAESVPFEQITGGHFGVAGMRERAEAIGGEFRILSAPGQGTQVLVTAPLAEKSTGT